MAELHYACDIWSPNTTLKNLPGSYLWAGQLIAAANLHNLTQASKYFRENLPGEPVKGAIFAGPTGNGRHTTAEALAGSIGKGLLHVRIHGADLDFENPDTAMAALSSLKAVFRTHPGLCLLLDEPQECRHSRMIQSQLLRLMNRMQHDQPDKTFLLIIVTDTLDAILSGLRSLLIPCQCTAPNLDERRAWCSEHLQTTPRLLPTGITMGNLAQKTEGFSWHQLQLLRHALRQRLFWNIKTHTDKEADDAVARAGQVDKEEVKKIRAPYQNANYRIRLIKQGEGTPSESELEKLLRSLREQLPPQQPALAYPVVQAFANAPAAAPANAPAEAAPETSKAAADTVANEKKAFNKEEAEANRDLHSHPEKMSYDQLTSTLSHRLRIPAAAVSEPGEEAAPA